jgi:hypothetical protein
MTGEAIEAALLEENRRRCDPPLPDAEVLQIAASVARYPPAVTGQEGNSQAWQEPLPFTTPAPDPIPARCLPAWLGAMVDAAAQSTETPVDLGALIGIAVASSCVAGKAVISPEPGYSEPLNLFTCPTMESGNRKTAVFNLLQAPVMEYEQDRIAQAEPERKRLASVGGGEKGYQFGGRKSTSCGVTLWPSTSTGIGKAAAPFSQAGLSALFAWSAR